MLRRLIDSLKITMYWKQFSKVQNSTQRKRKRDREWTLEQSLTDSARFAKTPRIYTRARMNNSRSNVYRGDFRKSVKTCEITHIGVFMRTRRTDSHFAASRILCRLQTGNAGASDLVSMPAMRDLGSLQQLVLPNYTLLLEQVKRST